MIHKRKIVLLLFFCVCIALVYFLPKAIYWLKTGNHPVVKVYTDKDELSQTDLVKYAQIKYDPTKKYSLSYTIRETYMRKGLFSSERLRDTLSQYIITEDNK